MEAWMASTKGRKLGRNDSKCSRYKLTNQREKNKARKAAKLAARLAKAAARRAKRTPA
jgi:hypothetical protein